MHAFKLRVTRRADTHVNVTVFVAPSGNRTYANCGDLTMRVDEYNAFRAVIGRGVNVAQIEFDGDIAPGAERHGALLPWDASSENLRGGGGGAP